MTEQPQIAFRRVTEVDFPLLARRLNGPHVRAYYKDPRTLAGVADHYGAAVRGEEPTLCHPALANGVPFAGITYLTQQNKETQSPARQVSLRRLRFNKNL